MGKRTWKYTPETVKEKINILKSAIDANEPLGTYLERTGVGSAIKELAYSMRRTKDKTPLGKEFLELYAKATNNGNHRAGYYARYVRSSDDKLPDGRGRIDHYVVKSCKACLPLEVSRDDMERIYGLYTYYGSGFSARGVANEFPQWSLQDIKNILRGFRIYKDGEWFPPHCLEEMTKEELGALRMRYKKKAALKYADNSVERGYKKALNEMASKVKGQEALVAFIKDVVKGGCDIRPVKEEELALPAVTVDRTLVLYLSDMHIGAKVSCDALLGNQYGYEEVMRRMDKMTSVLRRLGFFKKIVVCQLGDALDGMDGKTARRDHSLPQDMDNKEQVRAYRNAMLSLFSSFTRNGFADGYEFRCVNGNHGGDFEWAANHIVALSLERMFPNVKAVVAEKDIHRFDIDGHTFLLFHGKDGRFMKRPLPLALDAKTAQWFMPVLQRANETSPLQPDVNVVGGDLHNEAMTRCSQFRYWKTGSFFGSSDYGQMNYEYASPHVNYHVIEDGLLLGGTIELK